MHYFYCTLFEENTEKVNNGFLLLCPTSNASLRNSNENRNRVVIRRNIRKYFTCRWRPDWPSNCPFVSLPKYVPLSIHMRAQFLAALFNSLLLFLAAVAFLSRVWFLFSRPWAAKAATSKASRTVRGQQRADVSTYVVAWICRDTANACKRRERAWILLGRHYTFEKKTILDKYFNFLKMHIYKH